MLTEWFRRSFAIWLLLLFVALVLASCRPAPGQDPAATPVPGATDALPDSGGSRELVGEPLGQDEPAAACPEAAPGSYQVVAAAQGLCFLYPEIYDAWQAEDGTITLYVRSVTTVPLPMASISAAPSHSQSLETIATRRKRDYGWPDTLTEVITLGGGPAVMLDNLPGQDINRRVVTVHDGTVYDLVFHGTGPNYGEIGEQAELLYQTVISSLQFTAVKPGAPLLAGPECPELTANSVIYRSEAAGYCLRLPGGYSAAGTQVDPDDTELAFYINTVQDMTQARLSIKTTTAKGHSLEEIIGEYEAELDKAAPGLVATRSLRFTLDGEVAYAYEQVPGQQLARQVLTLHDGRLYTLTFVPDNPAAGETYAAMEELFEMAMDTFSFLGHADTPPSGPFPATPLGSGGERALYHDEEAGFEFDYLASWFLLATEGAGENSRGSITSFASWPSARDSADTPAGETRFEVTVVRWEPLDLAQYVGMRKEAWAASGMTVVAEDAWVLASDLRASRLLLETLDEGIGFVLIALVDDHFVALSGTGDLQELELIGRTLRPTGGDSQSE